MIGSRPKEGSGAPKLPALTYGPGPGASQVTGSRPKEGSGAPKLPALTYGPGPRA